MNGPQITLRYSADSIEYTKVESKSRRMEKLYYQPLESDVTQ